ncbi:MAG TPA: PRC-barrel domain-containing protein [Streptomyces sp.]|jgi:PRC-barrel domain.
MAADYGRAGSGLTGVTAYDADGEEVGTVGRVHLNDVSGRPEWVTVRTGLFGTEESIVPLAGSRRSTSGDLHVRFEKDTVRQAPRVNPGDSLGAVDEQRLYAHYNLTRPPTEAAHASTTPTPAPH